MIISYVNEEKSVQNLLGFIKSQIKLAWESYEREESPTFADFQPTRERTIGREEMIPDWFKERNKVDQLTDEKEKLDIVESQKALRKALEETKNKNRRRE